MKERLLIFIRFKGIAVSTFESRCGLSNGYIKNSKGNIGARKMEDILNAYPEINKSWLLTGEGEMLVSTPCPDKPRTDSMELPLIPINAMAGAMTGEDVSFMDYDCEKYIVPIFRGAEFLIRVQGDSMFPKYASGDIVACKHVPLERLWFQWGKTYVIDTRQGALVKRLEPSEREGCVSIHSENPKYKPFDLEVDEINGVAMVIGTIRAE